MKNIIFFALFLSLFAFSCKKETIETVNDPVVNNPTNKELFKGTLVSNAHTTSGTVKIIEDAAKKKQLVFENLKTDAGPDLRIYVSTDLKATSFTEVTRDVKNGTYQVEVPATADLTKQKFVLIWCKQFSVLFGSAELK
jgi:Electron transfer DM13